MNSFSLVRMCTILCVSRCVWWKLFLLCRISFLSVGHTTCQSHILSSFHSLSLYLALIFVVVVVYFSSLLQKLQNKWQCSFVRIETKVAYFSWCAHTYSLTIPSSFAILRWILLFLVCFFVVVHFIWQSLVNFSLRSCNVCTHTLAQHIKHTHSMFSFRSYK